MISRTELLQGMSEEMPTMPVWESSKDIKFVNFSKYFQSKDLEIKYINISEEIGPLLVSRAGCKCVSHPTICTGKLCFPRGKKRVSK